MQRTYLRRYMRKKRTEFGRDLRTYGRKDNRKKVTGVFTGIRAKRPVEFHTHTHTHTQTDKETVQVLIL
jgi:hypothetical protein